MQESSTKSLDILVKAIDNFWDFGFALDLAESIIINNPTTHIRFFGDNETLFRLLTQGRIPENVQYFPLENYQDSKPSETVILCFDMKAEMDFFMEQSYKIQIFILSYLRFDEGVGSMNNTSYGIDNITITHLVPSPRADGAGIVVRSDLHARTKTLLTLWLTAARTEFFSKIIQSETQKIIQKIPSEILGKEWISVFCYTESRSVIEKFAHESDNSEIPNDQGIVWIFFEDREQASLETFENGNFIWRIPYLRFDEYEILLSLCDRNIVRWENSAMKALLSRKPFLWDIYKESNGAHFGKLEEFFEVFGTDSSEMKKLFLQWNTKPEGEVLPAFLQQQDILNFSEIKNLGDIL